MLANDIRISLEDAGQRLTKVATDFIEVFERGDLSIEFYAPREVDNQTPHDRDEIYVVARGSGMFVRAGERTPFRPGDVLFVPAEVPHRFEAFTNDFATWVVFFGPRAEA